MVDVSADFEHFQLDVSTQRGRQMVALGGDGFGRRERQGCILLEGFMVGFHAPSFAIKSGDLVVSKVEVAGTHIVDHIAKGDLVVNGLAQQWLDDLPEIRPTFGCAGQKVLDTVMIDRPIQQARQPRSGGQPKRTDELIGVDVEQFFIVHDRRLPHFHVPCAECQLQIVLGQLLH